MHRILLFAAAVALLSGCVHATPVTAAPIDDATTAALQQALVGTCDVVASMKEGGSQRSEDGLMLRFGADGAAGYVAYGVPANYHYRLDGRNVVTDGPYGTFRADEWSSPTLKFFMYETSQYWFCKKR